MQSLRCCVLLAVRTGSAYAGGRNGLNFMMFPLRPSLPVSPVPMLYGSRMFLWHLSIAIAPILVPIPAKVDPSLP